MGILFIPIPIHLCTASSKTCSMKITFCKRFAKLTIVNCPDHTMQSCYTPLLHELHRFQCGHTVLWMLSWSVPRILICDIEAPPTVSPTQANLRLSCIRQEKFGHHTFFCSGPSVWNMLSILFHIQTTFKAFHCYLLLVSSYPDNDNDN